MAAATHTDTRDTGAPSGDGRRNDEARIRLLRAADRLMYQRGYEAVGVAELCAEADVRKGSFYHFFESKQALALAMLDRAWTRAKGHLFAPFDDESLTAAEAIDRYGQLLADQLRSLSKQEDGVVAGCRFGNFAAELATQDDAIRARIDEIFDEMIAAVARSIARDVEAGRLPPPVRPADAAADVVTFMEGRMLFAKVRRDPDLLADLGEAGRRFLT